MKLLTKLEKTKLGWWLIGLCLLFFFLRFPSLIEPYWYGDEGIYEVIGQSIDHGRLLYRDIWDNKPPLLYVIYALAQGDQSVVKALSIIAGVASLVMFFFLSQKLFHKKRLSIILSFLYTVLLGSPILEGNIANAEDFILLPTIIAGFLIYRIVHTKQKMKITETFFPFFKKNISYHVAGFLLGIAFLLKIVAIFDTLAFILFLFFIDWFPRKRYILSFFASFSLPFIITVIYFLSRGGLLDFLQSAFFGNVDYVGWQNTFFGIPQGLLIIKLLALFLAVSLVYWKRKQLAEPQIFVIVWFLFSLFNVFFSGRPYTHYIIVLLPSFCLLTGLFFAYHKITLRQKIAGIIISSLILLSIQFHFDLTKTYLYYQNAIAFITGHKTIEEYQSFFDAKVPRDYAVASFITSHTTPLDNIFIWGNNPQIYALAHKLPPSKYTVAYHVTQEAAVRQTQQAIQRKKPKYIIILTESPPLPFNLPLYIMRYSIPGATIYERRL